MFVGLITFVAKSDCTKITVVILLAGIKNMLAIVTKNRSIFISTFFILHEMITLKFYHLMSIKAFPLWLFQKVYLFIWNPFLNPSLCMEISTDIFSLKVFILHNKLTSRPEKSSFKFINVMVKFIRLFCYLRNIWCINAQLGFANDHIAVSKVYH